jgi:hypothetical protein
VYENLAKIKSRTDGSQQEEGAKPAEDVAAELNMSHRNSQKLGETTHVHAGRQKFKKMPWA